MVKVQIIVITTTEVMGNVHLQAVVKRITKNLRLKMVQRQVTPALSLRFNFLVIIITLTF